MSAAAKTSDSSLEILLANPRGFCAGVDRAIEIVKRALDLHSPPVYVRHEIVHNRYVVESLRRRGAIFVEGLSQIPEGAVVVFSAHGVSRAVHREAAARNLRVFDATCPLVTKVHKEVGRYRDQGCECILIGHAGHPEVEGTLGQYRRRNGEAGGIYLVESAAQAAEIQVRNPDRLAYVTQTTLSMDDTAGIIAVLRRRFPAILGPRKDDICYATQNRQDAVKKLAAHCDLILVMGSRNSSNSTRLMEISQRAGTPARLIDDAGELRRDWLDGKRTVGITAGASAPELLVENVVERIRRWRQVTLRELPGLREQVIFSLPRALAGRPRPPTAAAPTIRERGNAET